MVRVHRFSAVRPGKEKAGSIAAVPYDVVTAGEAQQRIAANPMSFLKVSRSDALLPGVPPDDQQVYDRAREEFHAMRVEGLLVKDPRPAMYLYRVVTESDCFSGLCCCVDARDYRENRIRRHELTRYDKEEDRTRHIESVRSHNGQVVLLYHGHDDLYTFLEGLFPPGSAPDIEVRNGHGSLHQVFTIRDEVTLQRIEKEFASIPALYIADGHHRAKSSVNVADRLKKAGDCPDEAEKFMAVLFHAGNVRIHGYSRLLADLGGRRSVTFLEELGTVFSVREYGPVDPSSFQIEPHENTTAFHVFHLYLGGVWYELSLQKAENAGIIESLDVTVLQEKVFSDLLGITDPRGDPRLSYLGGARPVGDLMTMVDQGVYAAAIAMQPVRVGDVIAIADSGGIMPPKSTWFEPKLLSGLLIHTF